MDFPSEAGRPPGVIADLGGSLAPHVKRLVRAGWVVCLASPDESAVRRASRDGAQDARPLTMTHTWPDSHFDVVVSSPGTLEEAERILCRRGVIVHPDQRKEGRQMAKSDDAFLHPRGEEGSSELEEIAKQDPYGLREEKDKQEDGDGR